MNSDEYHTFTLDNDGNHNRCRQHPLKMRRSIKHHDKLAQALREIGWVIWQPPPSGHHWELAEGRYKAVPDPLRTHMYQYETLALIFALDAESDKAKQALRELDEDDLDALIDALDWLAAYADAETIRRVEIRRAEKRP